MDNEADGRNKNKNDLHNVNECQKDKTQSADATLNGFKFGSFLEWLISRATPYSVLSCVESRLAMMGERKTADAGEIKRVGLEITQQMKRALTKTLRHGV